MVWRVSIRKPHHSRNHEWLRSPHTHTATTHTLHRRQPPALPRITAAIPDTPHNVTRQCVRLRYNGALINRAPVSAHSLIPATVPRCGSINLSSKGGNTHGCHPMHIAHHPFHTVPPQSVPAAQHRINNLARNPISHKQTRKTPTPAVQRCLFSLIVLLPTGADPNSSIRSQLFVEWRQEPRMDSNLCYRKGQPHTRYEH